MLCNIAGKPVVKYYFSATKYYKGHKKPITKIGFALDEHQYKKSNACDLLSISRLLS